MRKKARSPNFVLTGERVTSNGLSGWLDGIFPLKRLRN
jgi:hypothetical protein